MMVKAMEVGRGLLKQQVTHEFQHKLQQSGYKFQPLQGQTGVILSVGSVSRASARFVLE
jgi:hypothetical protein